MRIHGVKSWIEFINELLLAVHAYLDRKDEVESKR